MYHLNTTPSRQLLKEVRAALIMRESSLSEFARELGIKRQNLTKALVGEWKGPTATELVELVYSRLFEEED